MTRARMIGLGLLLALPAASRAEVLVFAFEGDVTNVYDPIGVLDFVQPGQRFVYTFSFDRDASNVFPYPHPNAAWYEGISSSLTVGGFPFLTGAPFMEIGDLDAFFNVSSAIEWDHPQLLPERHGMYVRLRGGDAVQNIMPPQAPYDLDCFNSREFQAAFIAPGGSTGEPLYIFGGIDSMYIVPEPGTALLLALAGLAVRGRRIRCYR